MKRIPLLLLACLLCGAHAYGELNCTGQDDTSAVATAINNACFVGIPMGSHEVVIPPGTCVVNPNAQPPQPLNLCSDLTVRGVGRASILKVKDNAGLYTAIFGAAGAISNVVIKDFRIDQNPGGNPVSPGNGEFLHVINLPVVSGAGGVTRITVSGMVFDAIHASHAIHAENTGDLFAMITNNYFNFQKAAGVSAYNNAAIYLEGSQQVVTGNTFFSSSPPPPIGGAGSLNSFANSAIETHGGRSTISNNTANYYATLVNVLPTSQAGGFTAVSPNNVVIANNSVTCAQVGISLWPTLGATPAPNGTISNVSITGNTIHVCNNNRRTNNRYHGGPSFAGVRIAYDASYVRSVDSLVVSDNIISMENDSYSLVETDAISTGGIVLPATGTLSNVTVSGNVVKSSPISGIRVGLSTGIATQVRVVDNTIIDAGNAGNASTQPTYCHAIGFLGNAAEIDFARNMIYDTTVNGQGNATNGLYSLYVKQASTPSTTVIRTSQNTVRVASTNPNVQLQSSFPSPNAGIVDSTNANNVLILPPVTGQQQGTPAPVSVDFTSFTRYIVPISGAVSPSTINVLSPTSSTTTGVAQWTVGQVVTFRFRCQTVGNPCRVVFDFDASTSAYSMNGNLPDIPSGYGLGITFQAENFSVTSNTRRFFELYRTPTAIAN